MPAEGRLRAAEYIRAHPEASLRQIARETHVSLGTVHVVREKFRRGAGLGSEAPPEPGAASPSVPAGPPAAAAAPPPVRAIHVQPGPGAGTRGAPRLAWPMISAKLASDPSLRYTEGGRAFLRWMAGHCLGADEWRQFAERLGTKLEAAS